MRKKVNKLLHQSIRNLAMWSISLLINTSTWNEMMHNWKPICCVFLQLHVNSENTSNQHCDALLKKIAKIRSDSNVHCFNKYIDPNASSFAANTNLSDGDDHDEYDDLDDGADAAAMPVDDPSRTIRHQTLPTKQSNRVSDSHDHVRVHSVCARDRA
jgi:hypothetical protein